MIKTEEKEVKINLGFFSILALILITLKLLGKITLSWFWVLCPIWGPIALVLGFCAGALIVFLICALLTVLIK